MLKVECCRLQVKNNCCHHEVDFPTVVISPRNIRSIKKSAYSTLQSSLVQITFWGEGKMQVREFLSRRSGGFICQLTETILKKLLVPFLSPFAGERTRRAVINKKDPREIWYQDFLCTFWLDPKGTKRSRLKNCEPASPSECADFDGAFTLVHAYLEITDTKSTTTFYGFITQFLGRDLKP